jgi:hypothetical protein
MGHTCQTSKELSEEYCAPSERSFRRVGIAPPFKWIAGMEDLKGRELHIPSRPGYIKVFNTGPEGRCLTEGACVSGSYSPGDHPGQSLKPFFAKLYQDCGIAREDWQDE